jgi:hypothetical protein
MQTVGSGAFLPRNSSPNQEKSSQKLAMPSAATATGSPSSVTRVGSFLESFFRNRVLPEAAVPMRRECSPFSHSDPVSWPPEDACLLRTCRGGSKATVDICESVSLGNHYAKKYVNPDLKRHPEAWRLEQGRLENDAKTYKSLSNMDLFDTFGQMYHETQTEEAGLTLYLEYAGSTVLANHVLSAAPEALQTMTNFFTKVTTSIVTICDAAPENAKSNILRKQFFSDRILGRLAPDPTDLAALSMDGATCDKVLRQLSDLSHRWADMYARLAPLLMSGSTALLPTDTTALNMILNTDTGTVKCIDPGKIDQTAAAYPLSKMLVFGPYYRFVNDKEFDIAADGFVVTKPVDVDATCRVLSACQDILNTLDPITAAQTIVAGLIQFGGDLGYRYNEEDFLSGKLFAGLSLFSKSMDHLDSLLGTVFSEMAIETLSGDQITEFAERLVAARARVLSDEVALLLPLKESV